MVLLPALMQLPLLPTATAAALPLLPPSCRRHRSQAAAAIALWRCHH
jgi:hypothetical protein